MVKITQKFIKSISCTGLIQTYWDKELSGFGIRLRKKNISYVLKYRNKYKQQRWLTIGNSDKITAEQARQIAKIKLAEITQGNDPAHQKQQAKKEMLVSDLCQWYLQEGCLNKKESTLYVDRGRIKNHILPLIGKEPVKSITRADIEKLMFDVSKGNKISKHEKGDKPRASVHITGGRGTANRTFGLLGAIFEFALGRGIIDKNPCRGIKRHPDKIRDTYLSFEEIEKLGKILNSDKWTVSYKPAVNIVKLILLTGCRRGEIQGLRWEWIDWNSKCFRFPDTKTGKQNRPFGIAAYRLLKSIWHNEETGWVFPATFGNGHYEGTPRVFSKIRATKNSEGKFLINQKITIHGLRHTFATIAADLGYSDFTIAGLLGHSVRTITSRYTHAIDASLLKACDNISYQIERSLEGRKNEVPEIIDITRKIA